MKNRLTKKDEEILSSFTTSANEIETRANLKKFVVMMSIPVRELNDARDTLKWVHGAAFFAARFILKCDAAMLINEYEDLFAGMGAFNAEAVRQSRIERGQLKINDPEAMVN